jgi:endonuclease/exonuclease/phosphatase family metal-dependent hydrolase
MFMRTHMKPHFFNIRERSILLCLINVFIAFSLSISAVWADGSAGMKAETQDNNGDNQVSDPVAFKVLSLNLAHGRDTSFNQFFLSTDTFRKNLTDIAEFLIRESPDVIALQEADAPSSWSGEFNHVEFLARKAGYPWYLHGKHVQNSFGHYGTAIISRFPIKEGLRVDFTPTPPTTRKGFTLAEIKVDKPDDSGKEIVIDVVSVHFDFLRKSKRMKQLLEVKRILAERTNPKIVMGDFNTSWNSGENVLQELTHPNGLRTYLPESEGLNTYKKKRLDWIFISDCLNFNSYRTAKDELSDHQAIISEIVFSQEINCGVKDG